MARLRGLRWMAAAAALVAASAAPASAGRAAPPLVGQEGAATTECPGVQSPLVHESGNGATPLEVPMLTGTAVPYTEAGAEVLIQQTYDEARTPQRVVGIHVTYEGVMSRLTTQPDEAGSHYLSRGQLPGETDAGVVTITTQGDGVYLSLQQGDSGSADWFVWKIGPDCSTPSSNGGSGAGSAAPGAEPVEGTSTYTG